MLHFPLKLSLYREGNKLWFMTEMATILQKERKMHEVFLAQNLIKSSGIRSKGTAWGYINNAVSLGIFRSEGTWKGTIKRRALTLTCLGQALSLIEQVDGKRLDFPRLNIFEKILFLKRMMELDDLWNENWISCIILRTEKKDFKEEKDVINEVSQAIPQLKKLKFRTKVHRIFPRLQWLIDLGLLESQKIGKEKAKKTIRGYRLTRPGYILKGRINQSMVFSRHYESIAEIYDLKGHIDIDQEKGVKQLFALISDQLRSPLVPIPLFRYLFYAKLLQQRIALKESDFDDLITDLAKNNYFQLHQSPYKTFEPEIFINGKRYYYLSR